jgi:hypothetical protein
MRLKIKSERDFWSGVMFIVVGVAFALGARYYSFGSSARPGPGYFPFGLGILMAILGGMVLFKAVTVDTEDGEPIGAWAWRPARVDLRLGGHLRMGPAAAGAVHRAAAAGDRGRDGR